MDVAHIQPYHIHGSMLVRRIVRLGPKFVCGICRTHHSEVHKANTCLYSCWLTIKSHAPFTPVRKRNLIQYACIYCLRSYQTPSQACECATDCSKNMEITEYGTSQEDGRQSRLEWARRNQGTQPMMKPVHTPAEPKPVVVAKTVVPAPVRAPAPIVAKAPAPAPVPTIGLPPMEPVVEVNANDNKKIYHKAGRTKKFNRAGAKYVCEVCLEKYFTKNEVEKCFDAHPD